MDGTAQREMPRYKCHKEVWALKIERVEGTTVYFVDKRYAPRTIGMEWLGRYRPQAVKYREPTNDVDRGYFVVYEDGYKSFSPAEALERGYTRIDSGEGG